MPAKDITTLGEGEDGHLTPLLMRDGSLLFTIRRGSFSSNLNSIAVLAAARDRGGQGTRARAERDHSATPGRGDRLCARTLADGGRVRQPRHPVIE